MRLADNRQLMEGVLQKYIKSEVKYSFKAWEKYLDYRKNHVWSSPIDLHPSVPGTWINPSLLFHLLHSLQQLQSKLLIDYLDYEERRELGLLSLEKRSFEVV